MSTTEVSTTQDVFDVPAFINSRHVGAVQYGIVILCGLMMFLDGFDTQAISYIWSHGLPKSGDFHGKCWVRSSRLR